MIANTAASQPTRRAKILAVSGLVVTALCWAGNTVFARFTYTAIPAITTNFWRWVVALAFLLPLTWHIIRRHWQQIKREWRYLTIQAILAIGLFNSLLYIAAHTTSAVNINLINAAGPVVTFLFSWWLLKIPPQKHQIYGLMLALCGLLIVLSRGEITRLLALEFNHGDLWMSVGMIGWCLYSVRLRQSPVQIPALAFLTVLVAIGVLLLLPFYLLELSIRGGFVINFQNTSILLYLGLFASVIAYYFWNKGVDILGPNVAIMFQYLLPVFAGLQALLFLGEPLHGYHVVGELLMFSGFYISVFANLSTQRHGGDRRKRLSS